MQYPFYNPVIPAMLKPLRTSDQMNETHIYKMLSKLAYCLFVNTIKVILNIEPITVFLRRLPKPLTTSN